MHIPLKSAQQKTVTMQKGESEFGECPFFQFGEHIDGIEVEMYSDNHEILNPIVRMIVSC